MKKITEWYKSLPDGMFGNDEKPEPKKVNAARVSAIGYGGPNSMAGRGYGGQGQRNGMGFGGGNNPVAGMGIGFTGYGADGKNQPNKPTDIFMGRDGPVAVDEGEGIVMQPDGSMKVLNQEEIGSIVKKQGIPRMQTGGTIDLQAGMPAAPEGMEWESTGGSGHRAVPITGTTREDWAAVYGTETPTGGDIGLPTGMPAAPEGMEWESTGGSGYRAVPITGTTREDWAPYKDATTPSVEGSQQPTVEGPTQPIGTTDRPNAYSTGATVLSDIAKGDFKYYEDIYNNAMSGMRGTDEATIQGLRQQAAQAGYSPEAIASLEQQWARDKMGGESAAIGEFAKASRDAQIGAASQLAGIETTEKWNNLNAMLSAGDLSGYAEEFKKMTGIDLDVSALQDTQNQMILSNTSAEIMKQYTANPDIRFDDASLTPLYESLWKLTKDGQAGLPMDDAWLASEHAKFKYQAEYANGYNAPMFDFMESEIFKGWDTDTQNEWIDKYGKAFSGENIKFDENGELYFDDGTTDNDTPVTTEQYESAIRESGKTPERTVVTTMKELLGDKLTEENAPDYYDAMNALVTGNYDGLNEVGKGAIEGWIKDGTITPDTPGIKIPTYNYSHGDLETYKKAEGGSNLLGIAATGVTGVHWYVDLNKNYYTPEAKFNDSFRSWVNDNIGNTVEINGKWYTVEGVVTQKSDTNQRQDIERLQLKDKNGDVIYEDFGANIGGTKT